MLVLAARGESQTAPRADLFRQPSVPESRDTTSIPAIRRLGLTKNLSLWIAEHFHPGLLDPDQAHPLPQKLAQIKEMPCQSWYSRFA